MYENISKALFLKSIADLHHQKGSIYPIYCFSKSPMRVLYVTVVPFSLLSCVFPSICVFVGVKQLQNFY